MMKINITRRSAQKFLGLLFALVVLTPASIIAEDANEKLNVVAITYNPPFSFLLPDGTPSGLYVEMWELWSETTGHPIEWSMKHFEESIKAVKSGEFIHSGIFINEKRKSWADFSMPIHEVETGVIYSNKINSKLKLAEAEGIIVAVLDGSFQDQYVAQNFPHLERYPYTSSAKAFEKLLSNEVQAVVGEIPLLMRQLSSMGLEGVFSTREILFTNTTHAAVPKARGDLIEIINQGWSDIPIELLIALEKKWLPVNTPFFADQVIFDALTLEEQEWLSENSNLTLGVEHDYYPIEYLDDQKVHSGVVADYVSYAEDMLDLKIVKLTQYQWPEALELLKQQKIDFMGAVVRTEKRAKNMLFTEPYFSLPKAIVTKENTFSSSVLDDFSGLKIGSIEGYAVTEIMKNKYPKLIIVPVGNTEEGLQKVSDGDIDGYIGAFHILALAMENNNFSRLELTAIQDMSLDFSFAVRKGLEPLVVILNKLITGMTEKQKKAIANNWVKLSVEQGISISEVLKWLLPLLSLVFTFTIFVVYYNRRLSKEIQRRKTIESELILATNEAESANEAKSEFLANMSHEIRTPMNAVLGLCQVLKESDLTKEQKHNLEIIESSSDTLLMLVNDILDISKIESGKIELESRVYELTSVLDHLEKQINLLINKHNVRFIVSLDKNVPDLIQGDSLRLGQILLNLCNNAAKFTHEGTIELKVSIVDHSDESMILQFIVTDSGIGMKVEQISKLFKTYSQADSSISRIYGGTGLGLKIAKHLIELMDGHIWVDSTYGEGSSFGFKIRQRTVSVDTASEYMPLSNPYTSEARQTHLTKLMNKRVLVVDDNRVNLMVAAKLLKMVGVEVDEAENGQSALDLCQTNRYDAVLMDLQMPVMDGYAATIQIKKQRENASLPIIALSANVMQTDIDKCFAVGMSDHIPKPLSMEKLYGTLASFVN